MEKQLQYLWQHRLWESSSMTTTGGTPIEILDPGVPNHDAGPDFFNGKVRARGRTWAGNIEIHVRSSDWYRHGHQHDSSYDSVILHVVGEADCDVRRSDGSRIPQVVLRAVPGLSERYSELTMSGALPACAATLARVSPMHLSDWLNRLLFERLQNKACRIAAVADSSGGDWGAAVYATLARALGFSTNAEPFERLAASVPLRCLRKHADSPEAVEGLLFGMAGFLDDEELAASDAYVGRLREEYLFLSRKFGLRRAGNLGWKMARMRPANFPQHRLAALAAFVRGGFRIGSALPAVRDLEEARNLFDITLEGYWARHYRPGGASTASPRAFSARSLDTLVINVAVPVLYAYGSTYGDEDIVERAFELLRSLPAEDNRPVRTFTACGVACRDAFESQALIELHKNYCSLHHCTRCRIGFRHIALGVS